MSDNITKGGNDLSSKHKVRVSKNDETIKVEEFVDGLYALEADTVDAKRLKVAWNYWSEQLKEKQGRLDNKKGEAKDLKTEVYQLIGFYTVFQGVLFQGVSALNHMMVCNFSVLPIILSAFTSIATLVGVFTKFRDLQSVKQSVAGLDATVSGQTLQLVQLIYYGEASPELHMTKVRITNNLNTEVKVMEGNAGVYSTRTTIKKNPGHWYLTLDPNATYREYKFIAMDPNISINLTMSSDDFFDLSEIVLKMEGGRFVWEGIKISDATAASSRSVRSIFQRLAKAFGVAD